MALAAGAESPIHGCRTAKNNGRELAIERDELLCAGTSRTVNQNILEKFVARLAST
jgi:hypothetical protein